MPLVKDAVPIPNSTYNILVSNINGMVRIVEATDDIYAKSTPLIKNVDGIEPDELPIGVHT